jgi:L-ascorbate metabolism protein UlaG (beta-lactamase superfamily)
VSQRLSEGSGTRLQLLGGPTVVIEYGGLRLLTDPTFDDPGEFDTGRGYNLVKTKGPALSAEEVEPIDVVLLSHDHHADNLDTRGRAFLADVPLVLTTVSGAERLGAHATALAPWSYVDLPRPQGGTVRITGVPAQHGPDGTEHLIGEVSGFILSGEGVPTVYVSGDNASLHVVRTIVERHGGVEIVILFAGGAQSPLLGDVYLTLNSRGAAEAAMILGARCVVPVHVDGWTHFSDDLESTRRAFAQAGIMDRLLTPEPGVPCDV